ncbi:MAG: cell division protein FtsL [Legionella sp.]|nr:cell division protein FtsL [Legionella sp.]
MNAAAKVIHQSNVFNGHLTDMQLSKSFYIFTFLLTAILVSALGVIYSTNSYRSTLSKVEQEEQQAHFLQLRKGQLLLEETSLATPARVEELASQKLKMTLPNRKNIYMLQAH